MERSPLGRSVNPAREQCPSRMGAGRRKASGPKQPASFGPIKDGRGRSGSFSCSYSVQSLGLGSLQHGKGNPRAAPKESSRAAWKSFTGSIPTMGRNFRKRGIGKIPQGVNARRLQNKVPRVHVPNLAASSTRVANRAEGRPNTSRDNSGRTRKRNRARVYRDTDTKDSALALPRRKAAKQSGRKNDPFSSMLCGISKREVSGGPQCSGSESVWTRNGVQSLPVAPHATFVAGGRLSRWARPKEVLSPVQVASRVAMAGIDMGRMQQMGHNKIWGPAGNKHSAPMYTNVLRPIAHCLQVD